jgi:hypothetical protein
VGASPREPRGLPYDRAARDAGANLAAGLSRRFRIVRRLGAGGMGTVFLAEQIGVGNRPVALKVLSRKLLDDPDFLLRFQNEAGSTGRIHHPNVVTIHESAQADDGTPYIAMEFLEGESLRQALARRGALPVTEVAEILQQAARGLTAAHKLGIIHRDLKPDNVFLTRGDEGDLIVKVVDFGIAKLRESTTHTLTGTVLGTPAYMSYEQASGMRSEELDARSDVYSLGVVVYEMLTGLVPFHSDTPLGFVRKHMLEKPPPFRAVAPRLAVPPAVESAVMKALTKDRNQRYPSAFDFARELTSAAQVLPRAEAPVTLSPTQTNHGGADRIRRRARALLAILASVIILGGTVGYILWRQTQRAAIFPQAQPRQSEEWGLPITLGQTSAEVRQVLGTPNEIVNPYAEARKAGLSLPLSEASLTLQYFHSSGIVCRFDGNRLFGVTLNPWSDYKGFIPYSGAVVNSIKLTDSKDEILRKLGKETKIEEDPLEIGTDRDKPVVWPAGTRYYWRRAGYTVQVDFLRQAQSISRDPLLNRPKDAVSVILVYK